MCRFARPPVADGFARAVNGEIKNTKTNKSERVIFFVLSLTQARVTELRVEPKTFWLLIQILYHSTELANFAIKIASSDKHPTFC